MVCSNLPADHAWSTMANEGHSRRGELVAPSLPFTRNRARKFIAEKLRFTIDLPKHFASDGLCVAEVFRLALAVSVAGQFAISRFRRRNPTIECAGAIAVAPA